MRATIDDYIRAKAIRALCTYFESTGGRDADWILVREYAYREWEGITPEILEQLIELAKQSRCAANLQSALRPGETLDRCNIPGEELPQCQFATKFPSE